MYLCGHLYPDVTELRVPSESQLQDGRWRAEISMKLSPAQKLHPASGCSLCRYHTGCVISAWLTALLGQAEKNPMLSHHCFFSLSLLQKHAFQACLVNIWSSWPWDFRGNYIFLKVCSFWFLSDGKLRSGLCSLLNERVFAATLWKAVELVSIYNIWELNLACSRASKSQGILCTLFWKPIFWEKQRQFPSF